MQAVYNFHWDNSYSPAGISGYMLNINGYVYNVAGYLNNFEVSMEENTVVHADLVATDYAGQVSDSAILDFVVPDFVEVPVRPTTPGNFGADFVRWQ